MSEYINVQFVQFPPGIHGASTVNEDNGFTIFIDPRDSYEMQLETYNHEMEHIRNGDFYDIEMKTARSAENRAHKKRRL
jgi:hypothetical protein